MSAQYRPRHRRKRPLPRRTEASIEEPSDNDIDVRRTEREHEGRFCTCSDAPTRVVAKRKPGPKRQQGLLESRVPMLREGTALSANSRRRPNQIQM